MQRHVEHLHADASVGIAHTGIGSGLIPATVNVTWKLARMQICVVKILLLCKLVCLRSPEAFSLKTFRRIQTFNFKANNAALFDVT